MKTLYPFLYAVALLFACTACGDDFLDINENPNVATTPPIDGLLANATTQTGLNQFRVANSHTANFVQYLASPNISNTTDIYLEVSGDGAWSSLYNTMTDIYDLIEFGGEQAAEGHVGIGQTLMAMNLGLVADTWGNAPYSDAFTGTVIRPEYDSADELYATVFSLLDQAETNLLAYDGTPGIKSGSDFIHGTTSADDVAPWLKTIASLRARYLNHLSETDGYDPAAVLAAVDNGYESNGDNAQLTVFEVRNPWSQVAINNDNLFLGGWLSEQFIDALNGTTYPTFDPRLPLLTDTTTSGVYRGTPNGAGRQGDGTATVESYLESDRGFSAEDAPLTIITFAELKFIEAEAALAAGDQDRADAAFRAGVRASMEEFGASEDAVENYLTEAYGEETEDVSTDDIFREKYVALFLHPETWVDARRYNYAYAGFELPDNAALDVFPTRLQYPNTELDRNRVNVPDVTMTDLLFWDR